MLPILLSVALLSSLLLLVNSLGSLPLIALPSAVAAYVWAFFTTGNGAGRWVVRRVCPRRVGKYFYGEEVDEGGGRAARMGGEEAGGHQGRVSG